MSGARCPICRKSVAGGPESPAFPFCSGRCKLIDLGNWLDGRYRVAGAPLDEGGTEARGEDESGEDRRHVPS